jgi:hypothetical protein
LTGSYTSNAFTTITRSQADWSGELRDSSRPGRQEAPAGIAELQD